MVSLATGTVIYRVTDPIENLQLQVTLRKRGTMNARRCDIRAPKKPASGSVSTRSAADAGAEDAASDDEADDGGVVGSRGAQMGRSGGRGGAAAGSGDRASCEMFGEQPAAPAREREAKKVR